MLKRRHEDSGEAGWPQRAGKTGRKERGYDQRNLCTKEWQARGTQKFLPPASSHKYPRWSLSLTDVNPGTENDSMPSE